MEIVFDSYLACVGEKHLGIACIILDDKFKFRYKVMQGKDGKGLFFLAPTFKVGEEYIHGFSFDSTFLKDKIEAVIRENIKKHLGSVQDQEVPF